MSIHNRYDLGGQLFLVDEVEAGPFIVHDDSLLGSVYVAKHGQRWPQMRTIAGCQPRQSSSSYLIL